MELSTLSPISLTKVERVLATLGRPLDALDLSSPQLMRALDALDELSARVSKIILAIPGTLATLGNSPDIGPEYRLFHRELWSELWGGESGERSGEISR